ncbi:hypothetical protein QR680_004892 [Steinernema hermaphroditum]|uniref:Activin types I and II receptor domain-containing protein n=1 Tax=Steinernema hermaphroditum TaxID=289476 RepID=A0AA39HSG5_9BILA|nr:hypothetical protein QR680_004892 [Steinernema hermaphroditum]
MQGTLILVLSLLALSEALKCRQGVGVPSNYSSVPVRDCEEGATNCENITSLWYNTTFFSCSSRPCEGLATCRKEPSAGFGEQFRCCCSDSEGCNSSSVLILSTVLFFVAAFIAQQ